MPNSSAHRLRRRPATSRVVALVLTLLIGWSSVEVLWSQEAAPAESESALVAPESGQDSAPGDDCACLCACACQAVHVVLAGLPRTPITLRAPARDGPVHVESTPPSRGAEPPFHPPRHLS